ncbi:hypothetical protein CRG98_004152 [Punica granatum]|uniref:Uncharacterized protein n=1 Tax=Punica granatum TaxID=22663 RepID=A0A2I0L460_PUNGR|nr:hypothetical protein CRG98_004152 [Punica granatum]
MQRQALGRFGLGEAMISYERRSWRLQTWVSRVAAFSKEAGRGIVVAEVLTPQGDVVWGEGDIRRWDRSMDKPATRTFANWVREIVTGRYSDPSPSTCSGYCTSYRLDIYISLSILRKAGPGSLGARIPERPHEHQTLCP